MASDLEQNTCDVLLYNMGVVLVNRGVVLDNSGAVLDNRGLVLTSSVGPRLFLKPDM